MAELVPAPWSIVPELMSKLEKDWPHSYAMCYTLQVVYWWSRNGDDSWAKLFTPGGKVDKHGTCMINIPENGNNFVFHSLNPNLNDVKELILNCKHIDWTGNRCVFGPVHERLTSLVFDIAKEKSAVFRSNCFNAFVLNKEEAAKLTISIPEEVFLGDLKIEHANQINSVWPYKNGDKSVAIVQQTIKKNGGVGVFLRETGELVAWALYWVYGGPGLLQTDAGHEGKGYGTLAARAITKYVADKGIHPQANISPDNVVSSKIFKQIGYEVSHRISWIGVSPCETST